MAIGLRHISHAKLPVADVGASTAGYRSLLGLEFGVEFVEDGELRGVQLFDRDGHFGIALRDRRYCASPPDLTGFDAFAIEAESVAALHALASRADSLGVAHTGVQDRRRAVTARAPQDAGGAGGAAGAVATLASDRHVHRLVSGRPVSSRAA